MSEIRSMLSTARRQRWSDDQTLARATEEQLLRMTTFTFETMMTGRAGETQGADVRYLFLRRVDHPEEHTVQLEAMLAGPFGLVRSQTDAIWGANHRARNDLYAALCGLGDDDLDRVPDEPAGEWSLRQILEHLIGCEIVFGPRIWQAIEDYRAGRPYNKPPVVVPDQPPDAGLIDLVTTLDEQRDKTLEILSEMDDRDLPAPLVTVPVDEGVLDIDVRFQLLGFAQHEREHAAHIRKWRHQCSRSQTDSERLLGLCWQQHGDLEAALAGVTDEMLDRDPGNGDWTPRQILEHLQRSEQYFNRLIREAVPELKAE